MRNIKQNKKIIKPKTGLGKINKITKTFPRQIKKNLVTQITKNQDGKSKHQNGQ